MYKIYFANKGHTREAKCAPLWPVKHRFMNHVSRNFLNEPGLVCYIDPTKVNNTYFKAHFNIFIAEAVRWHDKGTAEKPQYYFSSSCILDADYSTNCRGSIHIRSLGFNMHELQGSDKEVFWGARSQALIVLREAIDLFSEYFDKPKNENIAR